MSIINKFTENLNREFNTKKQRTEFRMPAVTRDHKDSISIFNAIIVSLILHPVIVGVLWLIITILAIFGIHLTLMDKPKPHVNDIEFVLVEKEETPKNKDTKFRSDKNSRTGGINDPKKPVSLPASQPSKIAHGGDAPKQPAKKPTPAPPKQQTKQQPKQQSQSPAPKKQQQKQVTTPNKNVTPSQEITEPVPKKTLAKPATKPSMNPSMKPQTNPPKPTAKPTDSPFKTIVPAGGKTSGQYSTGPISGTGTSPTGGSKGSGTYSPNPKLAPTGNGSGSGISSGSGKSGQGVGAGGSGYGSGAGAGGGNPGGGGGRPGIDTIKEPDFGPYMRELQRRIKMTWEPPKGNESKRVVLLFKIAKDGRLLSVSVFKSSGVPNVDQAAINAVKAAAPFRQLPPEFKGANIDIQFTFDYNVYGKMQR